MENTVRAEDNKNLKKILVLIPVEDSDKQLLESKYPEAEFIYDSKVAVTKNMIAEADIIIGNALPSMVAENTHLELMQLESSGADAYIKPGIIKEGTILANATGAYGVAVSEHMLGMLFMLMKKLDRYHNNQIERKWQSEGSEMTIFGSRVLVLGLGDLGGEFAKRMKAMGSYVVGIRRRVREKPDYVDEIYTMEALKEQLALADVVFMALPETEQTYRIMDASKFACMKENAILLNCGRGNAVDQEALMEALNSGKIYGAALDVMYPEPLPEDHPMWKTPNLLISPHVSKQHQLKVTLNLIVQIAARNLEAVRNGKPVENEVDLITGYRKMKKYD